MKKQQSSSSSSSSSAAAAAAGSYDVDCDISHLMTNVPSSQFDLAQFIVSMGIIRRELRSVIYALKQR